MKTNLIKAAVIAVALSVPLAAYAQARHDEKPHGVTKPEVTTPDKARAASTGGRHDAGATTHGAAGKMATKKQDAAAADEASKSK